MDKLNLKKIYPKSIFTDDNLVSILTKHKVIPIAITKGHFSSDINTFNIYNNKELISDLLRLDFKDLLIKPTSKFTNILEKDKIVFFVSPRIETNSYTD